MNLGSFTVDVETRDGGKLDVWIAHEGNSGEHYIGISSEKAGKILADLIDCVAEAYAS